MTERESEYLDLEGNLEKVYMHEIPNVPFIEQKKYNWCSFADLSMALQYRGYPHTQEDLFLLSNPDISNIEELETPNAEASAGPTFAHLQIRTREIVRPDYQVGLFYKGTHKDREGN